MPLSLYFFISLCIPLCISLSFASALVRCRAASSECLWTLEASQLLGWQCRPESSTYGETRPHPTSAPHKHSWVSEGHATFYCIVLYSIALYCIVLYRSAASQRIEHLSRYGPQSYSLSFSLSPCLCLSLTLSLSLPLPLSLSLSLFF